MPNFSAYKVNLDTPQPDGRKGESPRNAFTKYNGLVAELENFPERGSNQYGEWEKYANGTQVCLGLSTLENAGANLVTAFPVVFPLNFVAMPLYIGAIVISTNPTQFSPVTVSGRSQSGCTFYCVRNSATVFQMQWTAIGRWQ